MRTMEKFLTLSILSEMANDERMTRERSEKGKRGREVGE